MTDLVNEGALPDPGLEVERSSLDFPVVGLGASAGGLQAALRFFEATPDDTGMAFVLILHLSPTHESNADRIIQAVTRMPVLQVAERVPIEPNHVYVISPAVQLSMDDGHLEVITPQRPRGRQIAIDIFFRTLADAHLEYAIGIILSGTGSDGAAGIMRVKEQGGITIAQVPEDAEYQDMPLAAIATDLVDMVLPAAKIPQKLVDLWANARRIKLPEPLERLPATPVESDKETQSAQQALREILICLRTRTGHDFRQYKHATVLRRIERRMQVNEITTLPDYRDYLQSNVDETPALLRDMLISVTNFFRDREAFDAIEHSIVPAMLKERDGTEPLRIWVPGCATGEEAYTLAMLISQSTDDDDYQMFATDIDERAVGMARAGIYPEAIVTDVPPAYLGRYFQRQQDYFLVKKSIREKILFAVHNILRDPPFSKLHLVSCRNLLIYLNRDVQREVLQTFHFALRPGGYLFLGSSESADMVEEFFSAVDKKNRIYRANTIAVGRAFTPNMPLGDHDRRHMPSIERANSEKTRTSFAQLHQRLVEQYAPPSVVINQHSQVVHVSDRAGRYLRFIGGEPTHHLLDVVLPELRLELRAALYKALQTRKSVEAQRVLIERDGRKAFVNMTVRPLYDTEAEMDCILVLFDEVEDSMIAEIHAAKGLGTDPALTELEKELQRTKEDLQTTIEQSETSTEELKASNEELQAINEELRSTTEELETSKEELQSMNEELVTVNYELKTKVDETGKINDDLQNLIASTDIATIFVDRGMRIKRYTPGAAKIFNLISSDIGRSLLDITHRLNYMSLADDAATAFLTLKGIDREVRSSSGRWFIARLLPYRTVDDRIEGTVLTFIDITARREAEEKFRAGEERMRLVAESTRDYAIFTFDLDGLITSWNPGAVRIFGWSEDEALGQPSTMIFDIPDRAQSVPELEMQRARELGRTEDERWHMRKDGSRFYCSGVTYPLYRDGQLQGYAKIARDWTEHKRLEEAREAQIRQEKLTRTEAQAANHLKNEFLAVMSHELKNPLNLIQLNVEILTRLPEIRQLAYAAKAAHAIGRAVVSQSRIIDDLLDLSRINTGKLALNLAPFDLAEAVNSIVESMQADTAAAPRTVNVVGTDQPMMIEADGVRVEQIVGNLLSNALKFTRPSGHIDVTLTREGHCARLDVRDDGQGIAPEQLPKVFDMFEQGESYTTRNKGGLGIGLSLVRQLTEAHHGHVAAHSEGVDRGAVFSIWLPLQSAQSTSQPIPLLNAQAINALTLLLVDDDEETLTAFKALLEMEGATVHTAQNAKEGLRKADSLRFDIILSDIGMPEIDGYEFITTLRRKEQYAKTPIFALTGFGRPSDVKHALESGFTAHLSKPVSVDALIKAISNSINVKPRRRA